LALLVEQLLEAAVQLQPDKVALVFGRRQLTYRQIDQATDCLALGLRSLGIGRGDRVVIHLENGIEAVLSIFGILKAGAAFVPVSRSVKADKLAFILDDCEATGLIADQRVHQTVTDAIKHARVLKAVLTVGSPPPGHVAITSATSQVVPFDSVIDAAASPGCSTNRHIDLDLAALVYTSGSTGRPKGVMLTHLNIMAATASISNYLGNTHRDVILSVLPLSFDYGLYQIFLSFKAGARLVLDRSFVYPNVMLDLAVREGVTAVPVVPMILAMLLKDDLSKYDLSALRYITSTGAVLPTAHIAAIRKRLPHVQIFSMYGLTECKRVSFLPPDEIDRRPNSVGRPMDNVEVFVADDHGRLSETGVGELVVRGSNVMAGYWRRPDETRRVLKPGPLPDQHVLFTGDRFRIDDDRFMYFEGRLDDVIKSRGQRVSPKEVENVLYEIPGVMGAAVVGVSDEMLGSYVKAFLCVDKDAALDECQVLRHCARRLEDFMVPKVVEFVGTLPCTESGKIRRRTLSESSSTPSAAV
jgi:amino acid adenylation domain-containing protein